MIRVLFSTTVNEQSTKYDTSYGAFKTAVVYGNCASTRKLYHQIRAVVVAQLVEGLLPTPEIRSSNPNITKFYLQVVN